MWQKIKMLGHMASRCFRSKDFRRKLHVEHDCLQTNWRFSRYALDLGTVESIHRLLVYASFICHSLTATKNLHDHPARLPWSLT